MKCTSSHHGLSHEPSKRGEGVDKNGTPARLKPADLPTGEDKVMTIKLGKSDWSIEGIHTLPLIQSLLRGFTEEIQKIFTVMGI